jgi:glycerol-3-phosphate acyltransferase PlsY
VATGVGVFLMLTPLAVAFASLTFVLVVWRTRYVSLGSIMAAVDLPLFVLLQNQYLGPVEGLGPLVSAGIVGATLIVFAHRENIRRLMNGTESRFR